MHVQVGRHLNDVPRAGLPVVRQVHIVLVIVQGQAHLITGEGPRPEFHNTRLLIEGKVSDIYCTGALKEKKADKDERKKIIVIQVLKK